MSTGEDLSCPASYLRPGGRQDRTPGPPVLCSALVWLAVCSEGVVRLVLIEKGTLDHHRYIKEVLSVALRYRNSKFGNNWTFQQDNETPHTHQETQE